ncbi:MAG: diguanylate cyclase [Acidobacteriota bacterium]
MQYGDLIGFLRNVGKDPSRLIFEDELTGIHNRRFLLGYFEHKVHWESGEDYPLSLLLIDVDGFKEINDTRGHDAGDQVLAWMAASLKAVAGEEGLPIRFGGDEFVLLLPESTSAEAREMADRVFQAVNDRPFRLRDEQEILPITLSIGIASAPEDATTSRRLFQAADTALYHAKRSGRNQAARAADIDLEKVFPKTALHSLETTGIAGREQELALVSGALADLSLGRSQFFILEGAPGMGKTTFLDAIRRSLTGNEAFSVAAVTGDVKEAYRSYYLTTRVLIALLNQREDNGADILDSLTEEEIGHLAHVLPQLAGEAPESADEGDSSRREGIFLTLARFLPKVADQRPLVLLIDDMHFADEATLFLIRVLMQTRGVALLVCGSSQESLRLGDEEEASPLERFHAAHHKELDIRNVNLQPMSEKDIGEYMQACFPNLKMPDSLVPELAGITQGNPLFMVEVIRKLVTDRKVNLVGQEWVIEVLEEGYLPRSLEEIVTEKITALDEEGRQILEQASTLGDDIPVSVLTGSSELEENKVLEFLDRAEALGLVRLDFQLNDEIMRFLGKQVLEISYGTIEKKRRQELHEHIGNYQEKLYQQQLLPSASLLAYHFKMSTNQKKARRYEKLQNAYSQTVFSAEEASAYTGDALGEEAEPDLPLEPDSIALIPKLLRTLVTAMRSIQLYPPESKVVSQSLLQVTDAIVEILSENERLHLAHAHGELLINGEELEVTDFKAIAKSFCDLLDRLELQGIVFRRGVTEPEISALLRPLGELRPETIGRGFWKSFVLEQRLEKIDLRQIRYSRVKGKGTGSLAQPAREEEELGPEDVAEIPRILRAILGAASSIRLYPLGSKTVTNSIEQFHTSLQGVLGRHTAFTLAGIDQSLVVNGTRVSGSEADALVASFLKLVGSVGLMSITFFSDLRRGELESFVGVLRELPSSGPEEEFWENFAEEKELVSIAFNQHQYALGITHGVLILGAEGAPSASGGVADAGEAAVTEVTAGEVEEGPEEPISGPWQELQETGKELLIKGDHEKVRQLLRQAFKDFRDQPVAGREKAVQACRNLLDSLMLALQHKFTVLAADSLLNALSVEEEPQVLEELAAVLSSMSGSAVQFGDHKTAIKIYLQIKVRRQDLEAEGGRVASALAEALETSLDPTTQKVLEDDLRSADPDRQENASRVLVSLGRVGIPLLIEVIKQEKDLRVRQVTASLLAEMDQEAAHQLKRALVTEVTVEQRFHILEVIDTVTRDVRDELTYCLGDMNPKIRRAAFRLFERLRDDDLIEVVLPFTRNEDTAVVKGTIRSLASLGSATAVAAIVTILDTTEEPELAVACCQALGQIQDPVGIDALAKTLSYRSFYFLGHRWDDQVRATAAMALRQTPNPRAAEVLSRYTNDSSPMVRQLARSGSR